MGNKKKLTLSDIKEIYYNDNDVCMGEMLASVPAEGLSIEEAFELYIAAMKWKEEDRFYKVSEGELVEL